MKGNTMASITQLPNGRYYCQIRRKGSKSLYKTFDTRKDAETWVGLHDIHKQYSEKNNKQKKSSKQTFKVIGLKYCDTVLNGKPSRRNQTYRIERMAVFFNKPLVQISKWDVQDYKLHRLKTVSNTTCRDELLILSRIFKWAKRELLMDIENPCKEIAFPKANKPRSKVVTQEELSALLNEMSDIMKPVIELAFETAMRRSEILRLTPSCLHLDERILDVIDGKTGSRTVPLTRRAVVLLQEAADDVPHPNASLFPYAPYSVSQALRRAREKLGMSDDIRFHQLRHSRISMVAKKGFNQAQIMMISGHRDSRSVQRYTHLNVRDVIDLLD
jgi:integrase